MPARKTWCAALAMVATGASLAEAQTQLFRFRADYPTRTMKVPTGHTAATFTRNIATIDPDGTELDPHEARFDEPVMIAAVPAPSSGGSFERVYVPSGSLLASGVDRDGTTPLMMFYNVSNGKLLVFHGSSLTPDPTTNYHSFGTNEVNETTLTGRTPIPVAARSGTCSARATRG